jgi:kynurenine 3-monooxygenase
MAEENFYEMRDAVADPIFVSENANSKQTRTHFPDYFSKYSMVTFREDLPYSVPNERQRADKLLMEIVREVEM